MNHSRIVIALLSFALLISVAMNLLLFDRGRQYYLQLNATRLDPLGLSYYATEIDQQPTAIPSQKRVVFFGDSRAADWVFPTSLN